jgi:hypothetical protein
MVSVRGFVAIILRIALRMQSGRGKRKPSSFPSVASCCFLAQPMVKLECAVYLDYNPIYCTDSMNQRQIARHLTPTHSTFNE